MTETERAEVDLDVADQLEEVDDVALEVGEHAVHEPTQDFARAGAMAAEQQAELRPEAAERALIKRVRAWLALLQRLQRADAAVEADAHAQVDLGALDRKSVV